jgi:hypothetical protein
MVALVIPRSAQADGAVFKIVGTWQPTNVPVTAQGPNNNFGAGVQLYPDAANRRLYAYNAAYSWLAAYDLDTLKSVGAGLATTDFMTAVYVDPVGGSLFMAFSVFGTGQTRIEEFVSRPNGVQRAGSMDLTVQLGGLQIFGMHRAPRTNLLWLIAGSASGSTVSPGRTTIAEINLAGFEDGHSQVDWSLQLGNCVQPMRGNPYVAAGIGYIPRTNALLFGCSNVTAASSTSPPLPRGAARLSLLASPTSGPTPPPTAAQFRLFPRAGDFSAGDSLFDPVSGRIVMAANSSGGTTVYTFDGTTETYVGGLTGGNNIIAADTLDPISGRFYSLTQDPSAGLLLADIRATPPTQGANTPSLRTRDKQVATAANLAEDPVTHRLFLKYGSFNDFLVVEDTLPWYRAPLPGDPDRGTTDVNEAPGKTEAAYSTAAQGYGVQVRQVGGIQGFVVNFAGIDDVYPVGPGTREYRGAYLNQLRLTGDEASSSAITADTDQANTKSDLSKTSPNPPSPLPQPPPGTLDPNTPLAPWPYSTALCSDFGGSPADSASDTARATCHAQEHLVTATATSPRADVSNVAADGSFSAVSRLDPVLGAYASVEATGRGVSLLGGALQIGEVTAKAESWAHGRPKKASSRFARTVRNVTANGQLLCSDNCDLQKLKDQLNQQFNGVVRVDFPNPDDQFVGGSKGGYQALVQASPFAHLEDVLLNEQPQDRLEVPGMTITIIQDARKPGRTVVNLAGVETEAHYGISLVDQFGPDSSDTVASAALADAGTPGAGAGPIFGLTPTPIDGFVPTPATGTTAPNVAGSAGTPLRQAGRYLLNGLRRALALLPIWAMLLIPIYLSARRWLLLQRATLTRGEVR